MTPLRSVMVAPTPFFSDRGCHVRILEEARALAALGIDVTVCTYFLGDDPDGVTVRRGWRVPGYTKRTAGPSWTKPWLDLNLWGVVARAVREIQPHVLHAHLHEGMAVAAGVPGPPSMARILDYQGSLTEELKDHGLPAWTLPAFRGLERRINARADHILASHPQAAEHLTREFGVAPERITVTYDAGSLPPPDPERAETLRRQWNLDPEIPVLLYTGLLGEHQGTPRLLELAREIQSRGTRAVVLACGYPQASWRNRAAREGLDSVLRFTGRFAYADYPHILQLGTVALSPKTSTTEGNQKLYAYLQAGLPVVAFDTPINRSIVGAAGELAPPADPHAFVSRALNLLEDAPRRRALAAAAAEQARTHGSWEGVGRRIVDVYRGLV